MQSKRVSINLLVALHHTIGIPLRRHYYYYGKGAAWIAHLPPKFRELLGLEGEPGLVSLEIGSGARPQPGYLHLDEDRASPHLEFVRQASDLPFEDNVLKEILAIHIFEHIHPREAISTLREWWRVLEPRGRVEIHVPNAATMAERFLEGGIETKWALNSAFTGTFPSSPHVDRPEKITGNEVEHKAIYDFPLLEWTLEEAGFVSVADLSATCEDWHTVAWRPIVERLSLIVEAYKPAEVEESNA